MKNQPGPYYAILALQKVTSRIPGFIFFIITLLSTYPLKAQVQQVVDDKAKMDERVKSTLKENAQTIRFLENKGQLDNKDVLYYFQNGNNAVYVEKERIRFVALKDTLVENDEEHEGAQTEIEPQEGERTRKILGSHTFSLYLSGSNPSPAIKLGDAFTTKYNYFLGDDPNAWVSGVRASKELTLEDIYSGINLRLYSNSDGSMEFDWVMDAGADYTKVKMHFEGQDGLQVDPDGSLKVGLRFTDVKFNIPESYQVTDHGKLPVSFSFTHSNDNTIEFATQSSIDVRYPIVIDPTLSWGSFFDANDTGFDDYLFAVQVDPANGMLYCAGGTNRQVPTNAAPYDANGYLNTVSGLNGAADALPHVAVIYRINSSGTDIVDLTLYGPSSVAATDNTIAHGLSLSTNNVFIGGVTTSTIPTTGSPFDATRSNGDGFVAIFTKDLGTLNYATYLGGTGDEVLGVTSIRALSDNSFVAGLTANAALPAGYISGSAADATFSGSEMYIAKFTTNNVLSWGTYVGGTSNEVFNDLEVFGDGRVAFAGYGNGQLTEVNSAAGRSTGTTNTDGIIGVLNATGTAFNYLDEIGGANNDRINDVEIVGETLYWTGSAESGFPVPASGVFDSSQNGGTDVVVGSVSAAGTSGFNATYYGTASGDLGNGIRLVTSTNCAGVTTTFLLVFGTVGGTGLPTQNIGAETLFNSNYQGGLDMFFAGFSSNLLNLTYGTYMGGANDDYLGSTGDPRGANHLWVNNVNVYLGTTTHNSTHMPTLVSGGFDLTRTNEASGEDTHLVLSIQFPSFIESDYSDAPGTYGVPSHTLDCTHLKIGTLLDAESAAAPTTLANGDDTAGSDDEDGISTLPSFSDGGPQNISVTVNNISNTTVSTANLYGWIDLNSNGQFEAGEFTSTTVASGFSGAKVLTWSAVTVSGTAANHYLRIRLTTNTLNDNVGTPAVDERSTASASNGEVEDYRAIDLTCPTATTSASCLTQAQINTAYAAWLATAKAGGGCNDGTLTNNSTGAPTACVGGTSTVTFTYTSTCAPLTTTCMSSFTVPADASPVIVTCAAPRTISGCNTGAITTPVFSAVSAASTEAVFESAPNNGNTTDDCAITTVTYIDVASGTCPVVVTRKWTVSDACGHTATCNQTITVQDNSSTAPVIITCAAARNISGCTTADIATPPFSASTAASSEAVFEGAPNNGNTSDNCGITSVNYIDVAAGTCPIVVTRKWTITDGCGNFSTCNQTITITDSTPPTASNPSPTSVQCIASVPPADPLVVTTEADNCSTPTVTLLSNTNNGGAGCAASPYIATRIYRVTDACGNTVNVTHTITAIDNTPPTASNPTPSSVQCIADIPAADPLVVTTEADNCSTPTVTFLSNTNNGGAGCAASPFIATRIYRVTDACGNTVNVTHTITAIDNTAPVIVTCAVTRTIQGCNTTVITTPPFSLTTATSSESVFESSPNSGNTSDNCGISSVSYIDVASGTCPIVVTRRWTVSDACGNTSTCNQTINITDTTPPTAGNPAPTSVQCIADIPAPDPLVVTTEADNCSTPTVTLLSNTNNGGAGCAASPYIATRIYRVTDACGNTVNVTHTLTAIDNTAPVIVTCAVTRTIQGCNTTVITTPPFSLTTATSSESVFESSPNSGNTSDNCGISSVSYIDVASGTCPIVVTRRWTVSDACGNTSTCNQTINITDTTPPTAGNPAPTSVQCIADIPAPDPLVVTTEADNCSTPIVTLLSNTNNGGAGCTASPYIATRIYRVTDACGNTVNVTHTLTAIDNTAPVVMACAAPRTIDGCNTSSILNPPFSITTAVSSESVFETAPNSGNTSDNCGVSSVIYSDVAVGTCPIVVTRRWTVSDACGNTATCNQTITVRDITPPVCQTQNITVTVDPLTGLASITPSQVNNGSSDACSSVTLAVSPSNFSCSNSGPNTVVLTVTDACGNTSTCTSTVTVTGCADLSLTKTVSYNSMTNVATFTITVTNHGPAPATGIEATDQLPNGYAYVSNTPSQGTYNNISGVWLVGNLAVNASATLLLNATVTAGIGLNYLNKAQITEDQQYDPDSDPETNDTVDDLADGIPDDDEASATLSTADLSLTKTAGIYNPVTNQIVFTITVLNSGPTTATNVKVTDQLPNGYTYVSNVPSQGSYNNVTGLWTIGTMPNGASLTLTITATVKTGIGLNYTNAAQITDSDQIDPDSNPHTGPTIDEDGDGNGDDDDEDNVTPIIADLSLTKTAGIFNPVTNQLVFTLTILNSGPNTATGVDVTDQLPSGYTYVSSVPSQGSYNNVTGLWTVGVLASGVSRTLTITAIVNTGNGLQYTNAAQVTHSDQIDPDSSPNTGPLVDEDGNGNGDDDDEDNATPLMADLSLTKTAGIFNPVNNQLTFTITVLNSGPNDATNVLVTDQLPNGYTYVSNTTTAGTSYNNVSGLWTIGSILNGASKILTITAIVNTGNGLQYTNAAQITNSDQIDPDSSPDTGPLVDENGDGNGDDDDEDNATPLIADLSLTKIAGIYNPVNNQLVFTITVLNSGPNDATNVQVTDQLPNGYTYVSNTSSPGTSYNNVSGLWTIGSILNGASKILTITAIVNTGNGLQYTNAAQITNSDQIDPDSSPDTGPLVDEDSNGNGDDDDEDNATPLIADLSLTKTAGTFNPVNNQLVFAITIFNNGPNDATNVQVTDQLPNGYTYVSNTTSPGTSYNNVTGLWTIGSILNGTSKILTITAIVNSGIGLQYTNAAQITNSDQIDPDSSPDTGPLVDESGDGNGDDDDEDNATPIIADLSLTKTVGIYNPVTNQIVFTITILNSGPDGATGVQVTDQLPSGYTYVSSTPSQGTYNNVTGLWNVGVLANGISRTLTITATVNTGTGLIYTNPAQVTNSDQIDPDSSPDTGPLVDEDGNGNGDDDDEESATPVIADLSLTKTAGIFNPINNQLVFTVTVLNSGPNGATGVQVTDQLPNGYTFVSSSPSQGSYNNITGIWTVGSLANGSNATLAITTTVLTGTGLLYTNAAQITNSDQIDPDSSPDTGPTVDEDGNGNGDDDDEDNFTPNIADLSLTKTVGLHNPLTNQVVFTITVLNSGPNGATGVQVTDLLPNGFIYVSNFASQGTYSNVTGLWTIGSLANGSSVTLMITTTVNAGVGLNYTNAAEITNSDQIDPDSSPDTGPLVDEDGNGNGDDDDEDNVTLPVSDLSLTKIVNNNSPNQNSNITYTITVTNSGPNNATGVNVKDILPIGLAYVSNVASAGSYNNVSGIWTIGSLANGAMATLQIVVTVVGSGTITNFAQIINIDQVDPDSDPFTDFTTDDYFDNIPDDDEASVAITVNCGTCNVINGPTNPVCPGTTSTFNAQVAGLCNNPVYHWTVTGNVLNFVPNGSSITVTAGSICGQTYTVSVSIDCESCGTSPIVCMTNVLVQDATPPVIISCAAPRTIQGCGTGAITDPPYSATIGTSSEAVFENLTNNGNATDGCGIASVTYVDVSTGVCPTVVTRRWTVSDACGNSATCNQTINVNDTTNPVISTCAVTRTIEGCSTSVITSPPFSNVTVITTEAVFENAPNNGNTSDNCGVVAVTYRDVAAGSCPIVVTRRWTVTDACGNTSTCNQTINVTDTTVPFFTSCPGNSVINCPATPVFGTPAASDLCDASVAIASSDLTTPGNCPGRYNVTRTWTATDDCGNTATCSATITVKDDTAPQIHCPSDLVLTCDAGLNYPALINAWIATATASDACDANVSITTNYDGTSYPSFSCQGGLVITFTATDDCGNTSTCSATVTKPCFNLETWVYLEGSAVNPSGGNSYTLPMRTSLNDLRVLPGQLLVDPFFGNKYSPPGQPYSIAPWNYPGTEGSLFDSGGNPNNATAGYPPTVVDWVLVSLRLDSAGTGGPVCQSAALLHKDGTIQFVKPLNCCGVTENTNYYVVIEHRNHMIIMSPVKASFINHIISYDFRFTQSYEDPLFAGLNLFARQKEILPGKFAMFSGNGQQTGSLNADTDINFDDRSFWESQNGAVGFYRIGDYNLNGDTNFNDRIAWERNNGKFTSVPRN